MERYGLESLEEHEALEYLLYFSIHRKDTNPIAHALLARFGTFANVLDASVEDLCTVKDVGPATAQFLHALPAFYRRYWQSRNAREDRLETTAQRVDRLFSIFGAQKREILVILALNDKYRLLRTIQVDRGTVSGVDVNVGKIAAEALSCGATAVVLAHNHPGGFSLPSSEDLHATEVIIKALGVLGIRVEDHIVISDDEYTSMRDTGSIPFYDPRTGEITYCESRPERHKK